jgi:hypothetical protein
VSDWITEDFFFQNLDDTLRFSAPIFFAAFLAVLNWLQAEVKVRGSQITSYYH